MTQNIQTKSDSSLLKYTWSDIHNSRLAHVPIQFSPTRTRCRTRSYWFWPFPFYSYSSNHSAKHETHSPLLRARFLPIALRIRPPPKHIASWWSSNRDPELSVYNPNWSRSFIGAKRLSFTVDRIVPANEKNHHNPLLSMISVWSTQDYGPSRRAKFWRSPWTQQKIWKIWTTPMISWLTFVSVALKYLTKKLFLFN